MANHFTSTSNQISQPGQASFGIDSIPSVAVDAPPVVGRTVHLDGWVSTFNICQMIKLLSVGDVVETNHPTTASNLISIAFWDDFCQHLDVHAFAGDVRVRRIS